jgi:glycosyltransferase involved in cell wall biosynthesis
MAGWRAHSAHEFDVLELPGRHWKWRMRHGAWTLAEKARERVRRGERYDAVVTTDMLDLPAWRGLAPLEIGRLPAAIYFHENQLMYPAPHDGSRDLHFAYSNLMSAACADEVWFNSAWHRTGFLHACADLLERVPDHAPAAALERVEQRSRVLYPGFALGNPSGDERDHGPCHFLWAARWEQDKAPEELFASMLRLRERGVQFRLSVIGWSGTGDQPLFKRSLAALREHIVHWGWQESREDYERALRAADVVVSTARHEFFGIAVVEAIAAGAFPLLPKRLAYPEVIARFARPALDDGLYDGTVDHLVDRMAELCVRHERGALWQGDADRGRESVAQYAWTEAAAALDARVEAIAELRRGIG